MHAGPCQRLSSVHFRVEYLAHVTLGPRDFYRQLCYLLGVELMRLAAEEDTKLIDRDIVRRALQLTPLN